MCSVDQEHALLCVCFQVVTKVMLGHWYLAIKCLTNDQMAHLFRFSQKNVKTCYMKRMHLFRLGIHRIASLSQILPADYA